MKNNDLFSTLFIGEIGKDIGLDNLARSRMATLLHAWKARELRDLETLWETFMKQALGYLQFVPGVRPITPGIYPLFEDFGYKNCIAILCLIDPYADIDEKTVGKFWPAKLLLHLKSRKLNWGILTNGAMWRLYSTKSSRPFEDFVELPLAEALESGDEREYALFERFFHKGSFVPEEEHCETDDSKKNEAAGVYKCRLDRDKEASEDTLDRHVKRPLLYQVDEVLQYLCNGFIADTPKKGEEYTEPERKEIFESAVKLLYRCLFFFYAEARRLLPSERGKAETYEKHSIHALCTEANKFHWGKRKDHDGYDLWQHLKGLVNAVNDGDPEYGIMGYNGGLFDDEEEKFLGKHKLRNDFLSRALYLLAYVEPQNGNPDEEREIPYADLEVRHLGELYENILEYNVVIADAPFNRWMTKKGPVLRLESDGKPSNDARLPTKIKKGDVFFAQTALERKQTGSYYTPEPLVRFLNERAIIDPLREKFDSHYRRRFDEFLDQARSGYDESARQGATRSAVALIERFVNEELLHFKVCDPAMGSGHFLVDASNQMSGLIVELLAEIPSMNGVQANATSDPNHWRRLITRHCLYGVDLNPLAVNLARLSLWLNCFATNHRLTFIDHHLRRGNSLIGIRSLDQLRDIPQRKKESNKKEKPQLKFNFDDIASGLAEAAKAVKSITEIPEDDTDRQKAMYDEASEKTKAKLAPMADLFTAYLMDDVIREEEYRYLFVHLAKGEDISNISNTQLREVLYRVEGYADKHNFFHWSLAFPDVFAEDGKGGFDATVGNPPWDVLTPNSIEFFSAYDVDFRKYKKKKSDQIAKQLMENNNAIKRRWEDYYKTIEQQRSFIREPLAYQFLGEGDINTYKLFIERFFNLLSKFGWMSIVVPSGLYTDQGCKSVRELFLTKAKIRSLYGFENRWPTVFNAVDGRFKFVAFTVRKGGMTHSFRCAFMEHDPERLDSIDCNALEMTFEQIKQFSPDFLSMMELSNQKDIDVISLVNNTGRFFGSSNEPGESFSIIREFDMARDNHLFHTKQDNNSVPLYEGGLFWQFDSSFSVPRYFLKKKDVKENLPIRDVRSGWQTCDDYKLVFRAIASPTNERSLISSILPKGVACNHNVSIVLTHGLSKSPYFTMLYYVSLSNSFLLDYLIRIQGATYLKFGSISKLPLPTPKNENILREFVVPRALRLLCLNEDFNDLWDRVFKEDWSSPNFWYPKSGRLDYGPMNEREIRQKIGDAASSLTKEWGPHCGVHNRTPDRRDTGDRAQLRAEVDAYVAHLYGLSREDFAYILDTFPVLKRKEEQAFGEYMSKRKCLEEYDRIKTILNAE